METALFDQLDENLNPPPRTNQIYRRIADNLSNIIHHSTKVSTQISSDTIWSRFRHQEFFVAEFKNVNEAELAAIKIRYEITDESRGHEDFEEMEVDNSELIVEKPQTPEANPSKSKGELKKFVCPN